jgi:hypothetical protein
MTRILTPEKVIQYAETRLFGSNVTPDMVRIIELHNGVLPSKLKEMLGKGYRKVKQTNEREPVYFKDGVLFIPQYSGFGRRKRYEAMIKAYLEASKRDIKFKSCELEGDQRKTNIEYDNFAYDFVAGLFLPEEKYEDRKVFDSDIPGLCHMVDITKIIFGPVKAVSRSRKTNIVEKGKSEYLESRVISIASQHILSIGYVYADQAGILIDKMLREYEALARKQGRKMMIDIYMFGRVGGLGDDMKRHDLVFPTGFITESDLNDGIQAEYPMHNTLALDQTNQGLNFSVTGVIDETVEQLLKAREQKCMCVEMETRESVTSVNRARDRYTDHLDVRFGFVGHVSDLPLQGDTLADELDSDKGERDAVSKIIEAVKS